MVSLIIRRMILTGLSGIIIVEIYAAVMQREFQNTNNRTGKGFAVLGIYLFVVVYCKLSPAAEVQMTYRSQGLTYFVAKQVGLQTAC